MWFSPFDDGDDVLISTDVTTSTIVPVAPWFWEWGRECPLECCLESEVDEEEDGDLVSVACLPLSLLDDLCP